MTSSFLIIGPRVFRRKRREGGCRHHHMDLRRSKDPQRPDAARRMQWIQAADAMRDDEGMHLGPETGPLPHKAGQEVKGDQQDFFDFVMALPRR